MSRADDLFQVELELAAVDFMPVRQFVVEHFIADNVEAGCSQADIGQEHALAALAWSAASLALLTSSMALQEVYPTCR